MIVPQKDKLKRILPATITIASGIVFSPITFGLLLWPILSTVYTALVLGKTVLKAETISSITYHVKMVAMANPVWIFTPPSVSEWINARMFYVMPI